MGLFIILRHLVAPLAGYANLQDQLARKQQLEKNIRRVPPHLRQDVFSDDRYWRHD
ncbi:hypothetical protein [Martelella mediterranea]|uniref:Uncharacterized protein n=1 Tax=Martelella mediterranea DSM 17316 TaxID=1122214 RepID=A0A1U9Z2D5_9HYPH|nr:hypothetical protein [Martelella mediterranea]AQZ51820.1 hypothetical protein Mame_02493 [Martelella mediterranea DSM 17316]